MSTTLLRLVEPSSCRDEVFPTAKPAPLQLSLFDHRPFHRVLCLPMADIHGVTFARALSQVRHKLVMDARAYPYFDLPGLNRSLVSRLIEELSGAYVQTPLDLRPPQDQAGRWQRRQAVRAVFMDQVGRADSQDGSSVIVLVNRATEIDVLDEALRGLAGDEERVWHVQPHEAITSIESDLSSR